MAFKIFLSPPNMGGAEIDFVKDAFETNWIAPYGPHLNAFEREMSQYIGVESALAVTSGTAGIHFALRCLGVGQGDLVFCSDLTFAGSCNPILYQGAEPIFIDSEPESFNMSSAALRQAFEWANAQGKLPKAVIIVDLYGESANFDKLLPICEAYGVPVIEDAAEAVGAVFKGKRCGSFGHISVLSFNGNKIITTSGGGMVLSSNKVAIEKMRFWSTQAKEPFLHYEHKEYGYNYRMSNVCAAIGRGQLQFLPKKIERRTHIHKRYQEALVGLPAHIKETNGKCISNHWLSLLVLDTANITPEELIMYMQNAEIEARPAWKPMHMQPLFKGVKFFKRFVEDEAPPVSEEIFRRCVCLPSGDGMTDAEQDIVINELKKCLCEEG